MIALSTTVTTLIVVLQSPPAEAGALHNAVRASDTVGVSRLLGKGANPNEIDGDTGLTPLIDAALAGDKPMVVLLMNNGADPRGRGGKGFTPLHAAAHMGHADIVQLIVARGVDLDDQRNASTITPLHAAAERDYRDVAKILLVAGAQIDLKTEAGHTPLFLAALKGHDEMVMLLRRHGAECSRIRSKKFREYCANVGK